MNRQDPDMTMVTFNYLPKLTENMSVISERENKQVNDMEIVIFF
jgi:hypothetical protein